MSIKAEDIKGIDSNHLIIEAGGVDRKALLADSNIDIISDHLYEYWNRMGNQPWVLGPIAHNSREKFSNDIPIRNSEQMDDQEAGGLMPEAVSRLRRA